MHPAASDPALVGPRPPRDALSSPRPPAALGNWRSGVCRPPGP
jgi:hypothetical protein